MSSNFWHPTHERCGFILKNGTQIEVPNIHLDPQKHFQIADEDIEKYLPDVAYFWHSHPSNVLNLSLSDYFCFLTYPEHRHRIYGENDAFTEYYVRRGFVMQEEEL